ncbi:MAG: Stk1 family PASTA domain-containing Ser/Thr kinase [Lachnospiraceae bacterium]
MIRIGMFLGDRYEILEKIGSGGMADVYKAKCHKLNRYVAIKVLKDEYSEDKNFVTKFRIEAQSAACLTHNNIVGIYDVGEEGDLHYIVMELVEGITLKDYIAKKGKLEIRESIGIAIQVAQGLGAAHEQHIVHRDIKPQNIIISKDGKVKVTDFGIAKAISEYTINQNAMGSVHYLSPEQARGGYCDERSDIYSLGITLYEMVTGKVPFDGDNTVAVAIAHINDAMIPPSQYEPSIPLALEQIIFKCTQKKPERRYLTVSELIVDLKKAIVMPEASFVKTVPETNGNPTVLISDSDMNKIRRETSSIEIPDNVIDEKQVDSDEEDLLDDDYDYDDYDDDDGYEDEDEEYEEEKSTTFDKVLLGIGIGVAVILVALMIYVVGSLAGWFNFGGKNNPNNTTTIDSSESLAADETRMPDIVGMSKEDAQDTLNDASLGYEVVDYIESDEYEAGLVCQAEYDAGDIVKKNTRVKIYISSGSSKFHITDDYINMQRKLFEYKVAPYGLDVTYVEESNESITKGVILRLDPSSGYLAKGDKLTVYVSAGPEFVKVPDLMHLTVSNAKTMLTEANLVLGSTTEAYSDDVEVGLVMSQSSNANTEVKAGSTVDIVISKGPAPIAVPSLIGLKKDAALSEIAKLNLVAVVNEVESDKDAGTVIDQSPSSGTPLFAGGTVTITVSKGKQEEIITVPSSIFPTTYENAKKELEKLGLVVVGTSEKDSNEAKGTALGFEYDTSKSLVKGTYVWILVSKGPTETETSPTQTTEATTEATTNGQDKQ